MKITAEQIKSLRQKTGAGMSNCKKALVEANGDFDIAINILRQKGLASAEKKMTRTAKQGIITSYIHVGSKIGVLLELNCETDFVARRIEFKELAKSIAMQIAAGEFVKFLDLKDVPQEVWDSEMAIEAERDDLKEKSDIIKSSILKGRVEKTLKTMTLLNQACIREPNISVEEYIKNFVSILGENIKIARFTKFVVGENEERIEEIN